MPHRIHRFISGQQSTRTGLPSIYDNPFTVFRSSPTRPVVKSIPAYPSDLTESTSSPRSPSLVVPFFDDSNHRTKNSTSRSRVTVKNNISPPSETERSRTDYQIALERLENANLQTQMLSSFKREFFDFLTTWSPMSFLRLRLFVPPIRRVLLSHSPMVCFLAAVVQNMHPNEPSLSPNGSPKRSGCWNGQSAFSHVDCIFTVFSCQYPACRIFVPFLGPPLSQPKLRGLSLSRKLLRLTMSIPALSFHSLRNHFCATRLSLPARIDVPIFSSRNPPTRQARPADTF